MSDAVNLEPGSLVVIMITGSTGRFIAEVTQSDPLHLKVMESGPYARLKGGDYILMEDLTAHVQRDPQGFLDACTQPPVSGLAFFGIQDGRLYQILNMPEEDGDPVPDELDLEGLDA